MHLKGIPVFQDAIDFLKEIVSKQSTYGYKVAIASSAPRSEVILNMKHANINIESLDLIASGEDDLNYIQDTEKNKPKPYRYQFAAEFLKVNPKNCVVRIPTRVSVQLIG